jgi:AbrB family looped-hinge helix DNA binding protein
MPSSKVGGIHANSSYPADLLLEKLKIQTYHRVVCHRQDHRHQDPPYTGKTFDRGRMDALLTLSSKGQLVIPARLRQLLGLQPGDRLALSLEADGLRLVPEGRDKSRSARALIGCAGYQGPPLSLEQMDPALFAEA